jgi:uncharacterized protein (DUF302 family)
MKKKVNLLIGGGVGVLIGVFATGLVFFAAMPSVMLKTYETTYSYDQTIELLKERIESADWVVSGVTNMTHSLSKQGVEFGPRVTLVGLCRPDYAESVLTTDRYVSVMMPCKFSVWEGDDGKVYLTKMNMGMMGKMFGGNIAKVMGGHVAVDEEHILEGLLKK